MCSILSNRKQSRLSSFIDLRFCASIAFLIIREEFITLNTHYVNTKSVVNQIKVLQSCHISNYCTTNSLYHRCTRRLYSLSVANFTFLHPTGFYLYPSNCKLQKIFAWTSRSGFTIYKVLLQVLLRHVYFRT